MDSKNNKPHIIPKPSLLEMQESYTSLEMETLYQSIESSAESSRSKKSEVGQKRSATDPPNLEISEKISKLEPVISEQPESVEIPMSSEPSTNLPSPVEKCPFSTGLLSTPDNLLSPKVDKQPLLPLPETKAPLLENAPAQDKKPEEPHPDYEYKEIPMIKNTLPRNLEPLPHGWSYIRHKSSMFLYYHRETKVVTWARPYFLGTANPKNHPIPITSIPCYFQEKWKEKQKKLEQLLESESTDNNAIVDSATCL